MAIAAERWGQPPAESVDLLKILSKVRCPALSSRPQGIALHEGLDELLRKGLGEEMNARSQQFNSVARYQSKTPS
jgi:hypothetical protein